METISNNRNGIALLMNKHRFNNTILMTLCMRFKVRCVFHRSHAGIMGSKPEKTDNFRVVSQAKLHSVSIGLESCLMACNMPSISSGW